MYIFIRLWLKAKQRCIQGTDNVQCYIISWTYNRQSNYLSTWWRHQMETFSSLLALCVGNSPVTDEFPSQRPVTRSFNVFFDLPLNKRFSKQSIRRWPEKRSCSLWRLCNGMASRNGLELFLLLRTGSSILLALSIPTRLKSCTIRSAYFRPIRQLVRWFDRYYHIFSVCLCHTICSDVCFN